MFFVTGKAKQIVLLTACLLASACGGLTTAKLYEGPEKTDANHVVVSSMGLYPQRNLSIYLFEVDGQEMDINRTAEFLMLPGEHSFRFRVMKDLQSSIDLKNIDKKSASYSISSTFKRAEDTVTATLVAGHTYLPNAEILDGNTIRLYFEDAGTGFSRECTPLRRYAIYYGGSADGKKGGCK